MHDTSTQSPEIPPAPTFVNYLAEPGTADALPVIERNTDTQIPEAVRPAEQPPKPPIAQPTETIIEVIVAFTLVIGCAALGNYVQITTRILIPPSVIGLVIAVLLIVTRTVPLRIIAPASSRLLPYLILFFVPIYAGACFNIEVWRHGGILLFSVAAILAVISLTITSFLLQQVTR